MRRTSRYICIYKNIIIFNRMIKYFCNLICLIGFLFPPTFHQKFKFNRSSVRISINLSITSSISRHKIEPGMGIVLGTRSLTNFDGPRSSPSPFCGPGEGDPLTLFVGGATSGPRPQKGSRGHQLFLLPPHLCFNIV